MPRILDGLRSAFGPPPVWRRRDPVGQLVRSMLGGGLRDPTAEAVFSRLRGRFANWSALAAARFEEIQPLIAALPRSDAATRDMTAALRQIARRSGALRLDWLASWPLDDALAWLGELPGVSPAAAAAVLNVSSLARRVLVVDGPVLRTARRLGLCDPTDDGPSCRDRLTEEAPADWDADRFLELHVQLSRLAEGYCRTSRPDCGGCPVHRDCAHAAAERHVVRPQYAPANDTSAQPDRLDAYLRRRIARIERDGVSARTVIDAGLKLGASIDQRFVGGVLPAGVHQSAGARMEDGASRYLLALAAMGASPARAGLRLLIIQEEDAVREYGQIHGPGLEAFGVCMGEAAFVRAADARQALGVCDEALRALAAPFVILELRRGAALADVAATRRLNLQARRTGVFLFLITPDLDGASAAMTRWRTSAAASHAPRKRVGPPTVQLDLVRNRSGGTGSWMAEWSPQNLKFSSIQELAIEGPTTEGVRLSSAAG